MLKKDPALLFVEAVRREYRSGRILSIVQIVLLENYPRNNGDLKSRLLQWSRLDRLTNGSKGRTARVPECVYSVVLRPLRRSYLSGNLLRLWIADILSLIIWPTDSLGNDTFTVAAFILQSVNTVTW